MKSIKRIIHINARVVLLCSLILTISLAVSSAETSLPKWQEGMLDMHFIDTGRGSTDFYVLPDGTTMLVDAGDMPDDNNQKKQAPRIPDASKTVPQWIVDYIRQFAPKGDKTILDYAMITHWHDDHYGHILDSSKLSENKAYKLTGIIEVGDAIPIKLLMDRGYTKPQKDGTVADMKDKKWQDDFVKAGDGDNVVGTMAEYYKFIDYQAANNGMKYEQFKVGSNSQISLKYNKEKYPDFEIRNITGNAIVWTGHDEDTFKVANITDENNLSNTFKITYGAFKFFNGADISGNDDLSLPMVNSVESQAAPVIGPVNVAIMDHHANRDALNIYFIRTLRPRVWIGQTWSSDHPGDDTLRRMMSKELYPGDRDGFATAMLEANKNVIGGNIDSFFKAQKGHIVVRILQGGKEYKVYVLDSSKPSNPVIAEYDYKSK